MLASLDKRFRSLVPKDVEFCSLRYVEERSQKISVRQNIVQPVANDTDSGVMLTVLDGGGVGYAATGDVSDDGLRAAFESARDWARRTAGSAVFDFRKVPMPHPVGSYVSPVVQPWESLGLGEKIELLQNLSKRLKRHALIVDWEAALWRVRSESLYLTNHGGRVHQVLHILAPQLAATANRGSETQTRSLRDFGESQQGGLEVLDRLGFDERPEKIAEEVMQLLDAPNCPSGAMDLVLAADQMMLQIHESIGHPLELDRILGDERNYAGTSFVTMDMFGGYQYGSPLLNITFDPSRSEELASYRFDDDGVPAERSFIIEKGVLKRPLGSLLSRTRAAVSGADGIANARASSWNRPPIDRMANLNLEPGDQSFEQLLAQVERGVFMQTNCSWSIDDSRNKFQFGCEYGRLIENGKLGKVVKNPNYRGISATFWRSLAGVGDRSTLRVLGTPYCGKGEPNQVIRVGHASPTCLFRGVSVFGGE